MLLHDKKALMGMSIQLALCVTQLEACKGQWQRVYILLVCRITQATSIAKVTGEASTHICLACR